MYIRIVYQVGTNKGISCTISKIIFFWNNTLRVSDGLSVHHQVSKTVHTASSMCHTGSVAAWQWPEHEVAAHVHLMPNLRIRGSLPPLFHVVSGRAQGLMYLLT